MSLVHQPALINELYFPCFHLIVYYMFALRLGDFIKVNKKLKFHSWPIYS